MKRTIRIAGERGLLVDFDDIDATSLASIAAQCRSRHEVVATIVGHQSILVLHGPAIDRNELRRFLANVEASESQSKQKRTIDIEVSFAPEHAPDLPHLFESARVTRDDFLHHISNVTLRARFLGFRPGFAYLDGLPERWQLPRLATPRERVPAGSLGITGSMAGFYASESPGGWNLIGRTDAVLWDPHRDPPNLISAGDEVRIVPVDRALTVQRATTTRPIRGDEAARAIRAGQLTLFTPAADLSRYEFGIAQSGAFDVELMRQANAAVGNSLDATVLECTLVGPALEVVADRALFSFAGDSDVTMNGSIVRAAAIETKVGDRIEIGPLRNGLRGYLAIDGGFVDPAPRFAASPARVSRDDVLHRGSETGKPGTIVSDRSDRFLLRTIAGPHDVDESMLELIARNEWTITPALDRVGIRLRSSVDPPRLPATLPSVGMQFCTVQWHPSGELVAMGPDHPITGGYLQPMTIISSDLWKLAQLRPGDKVRFEVAVPSAEF